MTEGWVDIHYMSTQLPRYVLTQLPRYVLMETWCTYDFISLYVLVLLGKLRIIFVPSSSASKLREWETL